METFLSDIIPVILSKVDRKLKVTSIVDDYTVKVCDLKWSSLFTYLIVDGGKQPIQNIDIDNSMITFVNSIAGFTSISVPDVEFFIGSERESNKEWLNFSNDMLKKIPFVWCNLTPATQIEVYDGLSPYDEGFSNVELFFIGDMNKSQWIVKQTIEQRIKSLKSWAKAFIDVLRNNTVGVSIENQNNPIMRVFTELGKYDSSGMTKQIISSNLSAVMLEIDFDVNKEKCKC